jgi:ribosomal RNA-processing protein 9
VRYSLRDLKIVGQPFGQDLSTKSYNAAESSKTGKGKAKASSTSKKGGHKGAILCLAASEDGRYLLSGGRDKMIGVWEVGGKDVEKGSVKWLKALSGHKDAVTVSDNLSNHCIASLGAYLSVLSTAYLGRALQSHLLPTLHIISSPLRCLDT